MGREIRRVPEGWDHPKQDVSTTGRSYRPLRDNFEQALADWHDDVERYGAEEAGRRPEPEDFMPRGEWYQLFETVSEGTPLSPPFVTKKYLVDWLSSNPDYWGDRRTFEQAWAMVERGWTPSGIAIGGRLYWGKDVAMAL